MQRGRTASGKQFAQSCNHPSTARFRRRPGRAARHPARYPAVRKRGPLLVRNGSQRCAGTRVVGAPAVLGPMSDCAVAPQHSTLRDELAHLSNCLVGLDRLVVGRCHALRAAARRVGMPAGGVSSGRGEWCCDEQDWHTHMRWPLLGRASATSLIIGDEQVLHRGIRPPSRPKPPRRDSLAGAGSAWGCPPPTDGCSDCSSRAPAQSWRARATCLRVTWYTKVRCQVGSKHEFRARVLGVLVGADVAAGRGTPSMGFGRWRPGGRSRSWIWGAHRPYRARASTPR